MIQIAINFIRAILFTSILMPLLSHAQLSPGDLSDAHAHLEGLSNCTQCHVLNQKVSNNKCLACHQQLKERIAQNKGYHASAETEGKECVQCHSDHHGRKFQMIRFDTLSFDHTKTGFVLEGAHTKINCSQCHQKKFIANLDIRKRKHTYLGLKTDCLNCHEDFHDNTLSANCINCHSVESFKETPNFNHSNTLFPLIGKHQVVSCKKCHPTISRNESEFMVLKGIEFANCTDCHQDVHNNKFGSNCKKCHTEKSFHAIVGINSFDHSKTNFSLEGKHLSVLCNKCHKINYTSPIAHNLCMDCHDDYHELQFKRNGHMPDCAKCHTVEGFKPSQYTLNEHQSSVFPLEGAHLATPCFSCHRKENKWQFRQIGLQCAECHEDIHQPYLESKYYPEQNCKTCHSAESWVQIGFDHSRTKYPLVGAHQKPSCRACHQNNLQNGDEIIRFTGITSNCVNCHNDIHGRQFELEGIIDCARCHESKNWSASLFDHSQTRFLLDGQHVGLACSACHKPAVINEIKTIQYKFEDIRCESCHY